MAAESVTWIDGGGAEWRSSAQKGLIAVYRDDGKPIQIINVWPGKFQANKSIQKEDCTWRTALAEFSDFPGR